ncbi:thymidylate synthase [Sphingomonas sp. AR_OL41]|uniref:thymidylate synthase n=1 Tax=Sphingomonas sp. AR_OL41 TaxID=3042729 RepID=UPI002480AA83|nr:thymidylate synthase [Sphingomonas sp. AR_OL41]MDH7971468.1 thymidylate synthase [Sphingomonas sp. AR_OL41]
MDEILRKLYSELSQSTDTFHASKGKGQDLLASKVILKDPRARISATATRGRLISALAEFCWYMSGSADLDFIRFYIQDYPPENATGSIEDAYGPRLLGTGEFGRSINQVNQVIERLREKPDTRRAVISLLEPSDLTALRTEAPCTVALQFIHRRNRLHLIAMMRSNDAYLGFPHDVFCFTMIQEFVARALGIKVGEYHHFATSLHLYEADVGRVSRYLDEGFQNPTFAMPRMPNGCQRENLEAFLDVEQCIRRGMISEADKISLPVYWKDLALVLLRHADNKMKRGTIVRGGNFSHISNPFYKNFFVKSPTALSPDGEGSLTQEEFDLGG